jgi:NADPH-dependent curcumin reductase CurA
VQVLKAEYSKGVDVVYEAVGGEMFKTAVDALANKGCLIIIGMMSQYSKGWKVENHPGLPEKLLKKSATLKGARQRSVLRACCLRIAAMPASAPHTHDDVMACWRACSLSCTWHITLAPAGFFLPHYASRYSEHLARLFALHKAGQLHVEIDPTPFVGIASVPDAVAHLQAGNSTGKVVVRLSSSAARTRSLL